MAARSVVLIGAGRMGSALASGWLSGDSRPELTLVDPNPSDDIRLLAQLRGVRLNPVPHPADIVVIAVKPQVFRSISGDLKTWLGRDPLVLSIMAGFDLRSLQKTLGTERVLRAMPNTPGALGKGVTLLAAPPTTVDADLKTAHALLSPLGHVEGPLKESVFSAATALSGCGPAYVFHLVEAMAAAGEAHGLDPDLAMRLARQTIIGAAGLLDESEDSPAELREAVTSPGGVTEAALRVLMAKPGMPSLLTEAVQAAIRRDQALSEG